MNRFHTYVKFRLFLKKCVDHYSYRETCPIYVPPTFAQRQLEKRFDRLPEKYRKWVGSRVAKYTDNYYNSGAYDADQAMLMM